MLGALKRSSFVTILILCVLLVVSNVFWLYSFLDSQASLSYSTDSLQSSIATNEQLLELVRSDVLTPSKEEVLRISETHARGTSFEKDGCVWIDNLGFKFDDQDILIHITRNMNIGSEDPCFPR